MRCRAAASAGRGFCSVVEGFGLGFERRSRAIWAEGASDLHFWSEPLAMLGFLPWRL
jgi:hypothetical protein